MPLLKRKNNTIIPLLAFLTGLLSQSAASLLLAETSPIKSDEVVTFFPTIGYPINGKTWALHIHGWIYEPQSEISLLMRHLFNLQDEENDDNSLFKRRAGRFFVDNERGKQIAIHLGGKRIKLNNKSAPNGHFSDVLRLPAAKVNALRRQGKTGDFIPFEAVTRTNDSRRFHGKIQLIEKQGISVISDIDDTIKISEVQDKIMPSLSRETSHFTMFPPALGNFISRCAIFSAPMAFRREVFICACFAGKIAPFLSSSNRHDTIKLKRFNY